MLNFLINYLKFSVIIIATIPLMGHYFINILVMYQKICLATIYWTTIATISLITIEFFLDLNYLFWI